MSLVDLDGATRRLVIESDGTASVLRSDDGRVTEETTFYADPVLWADAAEEVSLERYHEWRRAEDLKDRAYLAFFLMHAFLRRGCR